MPGNRSIGMRVTDEELARIKRAAATEHRSVSSFVLYSALQRASEVLQRASEVQQHTHNVEQESAPVETTAQEAPPEDRPLLKLSSSGYPRLPEHLRARVDLRGKQAGDPVEYRNQFYRV